MGKQCPQCKQAALVPYLSMTQGDQQLCEYCGWTSEDKITFERMKELP